ncbi:MAG: hypothetical protein K2X69_06945 [Silvanigrellaceae bacterium]|nr:hypothetical protein [Silvanigrellaceae bacterium]
MKTIIKDANIHLKSIEKNSRIIEILKASLNLNSQDESVSPLQKDFLAIEVAYSYRHFGFSLFSKTSLEFSIKEMSRLSGVNHDFIKNWLAITADLILQEVSVEKKETLYEENILEEIFAHDFVKRIFCSEQEEDYLTGMAIYPTETVEKIREISRSKIAKLTSNDKNNYDDFILENNEFFLDEFPYIKTSIFNYLNQLQSDPLSLLSWRLESFISFIEKYNDFIFILKEINSEKKFDSKKIMAVVSLLVPHSDDIGNLLLPHSPITASQISKIFSPDFKSEKFQVDILKNWINPSPGEGIKKDIENLLEIGVDFGLFFKIPSGNKSFSYGLSENGLKIIKPFHKVLTDTILSSSIDHL